MVYMLLVFAHLLAASTALGLIVATDLRLLSKLAADEIRIAPPNEFVRRIIMLALFLLYVTGGAIVWHGLGERPDYLLNPKLQAKIALVVLLTVNAFVLHRVTFPRLARGRRIKRWKVADWMAVAVPVALSNSLWMFVSFLGVARPWNYSMPFPDIFEVALAIYLVMQLGVALILVAAGRNVEQGEVRWADGLTRLLAAVGNLGSSTPAIHPHKVLAPKQRCAQMNVHSDVPRVVKEPPPAYVPPRAYARSTQIGAQVEETVRFAEDVKRRVHVAPSPQELRHVCDDGEQPRAAEKTA